MEVINAGYPMTHTGEQLIALKKYGLQYNEGLGLLDPASRSLREKSHLAEDLSNLPCR
ncbi:MAG: hypothetical protein GDA48_01745 [Hormoscilla sp. GM102CHS1]|nr:hypothetical protein [Hormoscilla sp. GM102CHS1]